MPRIITTPVIWTQLHPRATLDHLGLIPEFLRGDDPRPAAEQFADRYQHGGGWRPLKGWTMRKDGTIEYPGDGPEPETYPVLFEARLGNELVRVYPYGWVAIVQPDGAFAVARMD